MTSATEQPTAFEAAILAMIASETNDAALRERLRDIRVVSCEHTGCGCYTNLDPIAITPGTTAGHGVRGPLSGPFFESAALKHPGGSLLWFEEGRVDCLEIYTHADEGPEDHSQLVPFEIVTVRRRSCARDGHTSGTPSTARRVSSARRSM